MGVTVPGKRMMSRSGMTGRPWAKASRNSSRAVASKLPWAAASAAEAATETAAAAEAAAWEGFFEGVFFMPAGTRSSCEFLLVLLQDEHRLLAVLHHLARDQALGHVRAGGKVEHDGQEGRFHHGAEAARAGLALERAIDDG